MFWLFGLLAMSASLRIYGLGDSDFWLDELHSQANSAGRRAEFESPPVGVIFPHAPGSTRLTERSHWRTVWRGMSDDSHPPAYFVLLYFWRRAFGDGEFAVRLLPVLCSVLSLVPLGLIFRDLRRPVVGLAVIGVLGVSYGHIWIAQENRPYSLGLLLVCLGFQLVGRWLVHADRFSLRRRGTWACAYALVSFGAVMTHYFCAVALLAQLVVLVTMAPRANRRVWLGSFLVATLGFGVIWGPMLLEQWAQIVDQQWLQPAESSHLLKTALRLTGLPVRLLVWHQHYVPGYVSAMVGLVVFAGLLWVLRPHRDTAVGVCAVWLFVPIVCFALVDLVTGRQLLQHLRYVSFAMPGLVGLLVLALRRLRAPWDRVGFAVVVAVMLFFMRLPGAVNPRARLAAQHMADQWRPGGLLVFEAIGWDNWARYSYQTVRHYLPYLGESPVDVLIIQDPPTGELTAAIKNYPSVLMVSARAGAETNPAPETFHKVLQTGYVRAVGELSLYERIDVPPDP